MKPVPGSRDMQQAIGHCVDAIQRAGDNRGMEMDMLISLATALEKATYGMKQALQAIYDEVR